VCGLLALFADQSPIVCCCFHAHKEAVVLCAAGVGGFVFCLFWHSTLVHFGLFSSLNLMMRSSPARLRKKILERGICMHYSYLMISGNREGGTLLYE
jgi:hypothetical protein